MKMYKRQENGYLLSVGLNCGGDEISEVEYNEIMSVIRSCPNENGKGYRLRTDLTWEEYDLPPVVLSDDDELTDEEAYNIIMGVRE